MEEEELSPSFTSFTLVVRIGFDLAVGQIEGVVGAVLRPTPRFHSIERERVLSMFLRQANASHVLLQVLGS